MNVRKAFLLCGLLLSSALGLGNRDCASDNDASSVDSVTLDMIEATGERAALVVIVQPGAWQAARDTLRTLLGSRGETTPLLQRVVSAPDVRAAALAAAGAFGLDAGEPEDYSTWDLQRPLVAALFETTGEEIALAEGLLQPDFAQRGLPGIGHRILIPASDPQRLAATIAAMVPGQPLPPPPGLAGTRIFATAERDAFTAVIAEAGRVRIELLTDRVPAASGQDRSEAPAAWLERIATAPRATLPKTPALRQAAVEQQLFSLYLRCWRLRALHARQATGSVLQALGYANAQEMPVLQAKAAAEVSQGSWLLAPQGAEVDDAAAGLRVDGGLRLQAVASLTAAGARAWRAGADARAATFTLEADRAVLRMRLLTDLQTVWQAAEPPQTFGELQNMAELSVAVRECGWHCPLGLMLRNPLGLTRTALRLSGLRGTLPALGGADAALLALDAGRPKATRAAIALDLAEASDVETLRSAAASLERRGIGDVRLVNRPHGQRRLVLLGMGIDPAAVYARDSDGPAGGDVLRAEIDFPALVAGIGGLAPEAAPWLNDIDRLDLRLARSGRVLSAQLLATLQDDSRTGFVQPVGSGDEAWESPDLARARSGGAPCLLRAIRVLVKGLTDFAYAPRRRKADLLLGMLERASEPLACARKDALTEQQARRIETDAVIFAARALEHQGDRKRAIELLAEACQRGLRPTCRRAQELRARSEPEPKRGSDTPPVKPSRPQGMTP
jgi:hypothetical protein